MLAQSLEYPCEATNMRDKGGIEKCITKAKGDMVEKVWGKNGGTRLVLSLKGEKDLPRRKKPLQDRRVLLEKEGTPKSNLWTVACPV